MKKPLSPGSKIDPSRRVFLKQGAALVVWGAAWIFFGPEFANAKTGKISKKAAHYRSHPQDGKMCMNCTHFLPPNPQLKRMMQNMPESGGMMQEMGEMGGGMMQKMGRCEVVEDFVSPMGYCNLYSPVPRS